MVKIFLLTALALFFASCGLLGEQSVKPSQKAFADEDTYILFALRAEQVRNNKLASELFEVLYNKSHKKEYLYRTLENELVAKEYKHVLQRIDSLEGEELQDPKLMRYKVVALFELSELDRAIELSVALAAKTKEPTDYLLTSDIYIKRGEFDLAVRYLESAYAKEHNEEILDKMSIILYVNMNKKREAIAHLETHSRMLGCSERVCLRLIAFYSNDNNIEGLLSTYKRLYEFKKSDEVAKKIIQIYAYTREYLKLMEFLETSGVDDEALLELYVSTKKYKKAYLLAQKLYEESSDIKYLGQSAIYEYESFQKRDDKELLKRVVSKLERVAQETKDPMYLNYLGYILIDHDIDVPKGIAYIKEVLKVQPDSAYFLDSLAWGYYKLGKCVKAKEILKKVITLEGGTEQEVLQHLEYVNRCLKKRKGKK